MPDIVLIISLTILGCAQTKNYLDAAKAAADNTVGGRTGEGEKSADRAEDNKPEKDGSYCGCSGSDLIWNKKHSCLYLAVSLSAGLCLLLCRWTGMGRGPEIFGQHKLTMLLLLTLSMAVVDARLKVIPNRFLLVAAAARAALYIPEFLSNKAMSILAGFTSCPDSDNFTCAAGAAGQNFKAFFQSVCSDLAAALLLGVVFLIAAHISRYQLGMGDVKLFALMGFYLGLRDAGLAIFCSFVVSGLTAVLLILRKKRRVSDSMAFAPCVFLGLFAYSLLTATSLWPA